MQAVAASADHGARAAWRFRDGVADHEHTKRDARDASARTELDIDDVRRRLKSIFIGSMGNLVEWYDFYVYTAFVLYFAPKILSAPRSRRSAAGGGGSLCCDVSFTAS
jgi:hypothetical protein